MPSKISERAVAAKIICRVLTKNQTLKTLLPQYLEQFKEKKDRALVQELCYGVTRWYHQLDFILACLLDKKIKPKDVDIKALAMVGLYQFLYLRTPPHAVVAATVDACTDLGKPWAKNLVNALLRRYQREHGSISENMESRFSAKYSHPEWLLHLIKRDYPQNWQEICNTNNSHPPMYIRINRLKTTRDKYMGLLSQAGIESRIIPHSLAGIKLGKPVEINQLPKFHDGHVSVQDYAAQLTAELIDLKCNQRLLDACAAPGGKLSHIMENAPKQVQVIAIDSDKLRLNKMQQALDRLQLRVKPVHADARNAECWWDGSQFDRILLDLPCSATGVIRRNPDIKLLRTPGDIENVLLLQKQLLASLWPLLKPEGKLLYVTCSVLKQENDQQINDFISCHDNAKPLPLNAPWGTATVFGRQIYPGQEDMDGFYYACLQKT
jgi:16S rRNA (cytosine967-C5)-methyltransferase